MVIYMNGHDSVRIAKSSPNIALEVYEDIKGSMYGPYDMVP